MRKKILVVDDEVEVVKCLRRLLRREFDVEVASSGPEALEKLTLGPVDLVLSDFRMPQMNGAELMAEVSRRQPLAQRVLLSGYADLESVLASMNEGGACRFIRKPWDDEELLATLRQLIAAHDLLAGLYNPFRKLTNAQVSHTEGRVQVAVKAPHGVAFAREQALQVIRKFVGSIEESELALVGGLLEEHSGRLSFVAQVGGEQTLTLELPVHVLGGAVQLDRKV